MAWRKHSKNRLWTKKQEDKLTDLYRSNIAMDIIMRRTGRSTRAIVSRVYKLGIHRDKNIPLGMRTGEPWTADEDRKLVRVMSDGKLSYDGMARALRRTLKSVDSRAHVIGARNRRRNG